MNKSMLKASLPFICPGAGSIMKNVSKSATAEKDKEHDGPAMEN
jgi:hypothetical protein